MYLVRSKTETQSQVSLTPTTKAFTTLYLLPLGQLIDTWCASYVHHETSVCLGNGIGFLPECVTHLKRSRIRNGWILFKGQILGLQRK